MKVFIVGYMGSGKTSFGKKLAKHLGFEHIDLDAIIEQNDGRTIREIFEEEGEVYFRKLERHELIDVFNRENVVVSTGGGTPTYADNMLLLNKQGVSVYLKTSPKALAQRLSQKMNNRPLLEGLKEAGLLEFIENHLKERRPFYEQAHLSIDSLGWKKLDLAEFETQLRSYRNQE